MVALGIGLLVGTERERRKGEGPSRGPAGIRTFTVISLTGAIADVLGGGMLLATVVAGIALLAAASHWVARAEDPGLTTEAAMILTALLGALAMRQPALAAGLGVVVAGVLAARSRLHRFARQVLTEAELNDALLFAAATLVVLPLLPDRAMGPYEALNPHSIWILVVLVMGISGSGYIAVRLLGARFGLPLAGLASGFVSSTATIGAMGAKVAVSRELLPAAAAAAVLSTVATVLQMAVVLAATSTATLRLLAVPLVCAGIAAGIYGGLFTFRLLRQKTGAEPDRGRAFSLGTALAFAATLSGILVASAALREWFGEAGTLWAAALAGLVDTHSVAISIAEQVAAGRIGPESVVLPILAGFSTNTLSKIVVALMSGGPGFAARVIPGLVLVALAAWAGGYGMAMPG